MRADERVFYIDDDGVARLADEDLAATIYFQNEEEMFDFKEWLEDLGGEFFARYRDSKKFDEFKTRGYPEICITCKWFDYKNYQCFDGHGQYRQRKECEDFEKNDT